jgi:formylmethanofuran dehydrogenase subunit E
LEVIMEEIVESNGMDFEVCLDEAKAFHGDLCAGIMLGTRMAMLGLEAIGIGDPKGADRKNIIVYVETDRCASDAILAVTGCHPGKRTMKILDHGKMAATFVNLKTGKAVRVAAKNNDGNRVVTREEIEKSPYGKEYAMRPAEELFEMREVRVDLKPEDLPGKPLRIVTCEACGERIMDLREVLKDGKTVCRACASGTSYYKPVE